MRTRVLEAVILALILTAIFVGGVILLEPIFFDRSAQVLGLEILPISAGGMPGVIAVLGVVISVLIAYVTYLIKTGTERAEKIAHHVSRESITTSAQLRQLYDHSPVPYLTLLKGGTIHNPNIAALKLFGMSLEDLEGKKLFEMNPEEDVEVARSLAARFDSGVSFEGHEIRIVRGDGQVRWIMLSIFLFRALGTTGKRGLVTLVDITDQKNLDKAKTEFVSLASHQLRTPLSTVKWHTEMLLSDKHGTLNEKQKEYVQKVRHGNQAMVDLVGTLLNVSRIEMGTLQVDIQDVDADALVEDILLELEPQINTKSLSMQKDYTAGVNIKSDPKLLRIVVQNLISNAVKYTPEKGTVKITLGKQGGKNAIIVADTGYGIPPEQQSRIFTKMFRADNVRKTNAEGTGLGLYLVKSIVEILGGTIGFASELNKGTTFTVLLP